MKKILISALSLSILLTGCGQKDKNEETTKSDKIETSKSEDAKKKIKKQKEEKVTTEKPTTEEPTTEITTSESNTTGNDSAEKKKSLNVKNITNRNDLESIIYSGNYSEVEKITAYNSAVANGVIPQGNVMEGPASAAYESSLRVESGQQKSAYTSNPDPNNPATAKYDHLYNSSNATDDIDPNWTPDTENTEDVDAWRENVPGGLSSGEIQMKYLIENGQYNEPDAQEIYNAILAKEQQYGQ